MFFEKLSALKEHAGNHHTAGIYLPQRKIAFCTIAKNGLTMWKSVLLRILNLDYKHVKWWSTKTQSHGLMNQQHITPKYRMSFLSPNELSNIMNDDE